MHLPSRMPLEQPNRATEKKKDQSDSSPSPEPSPQGTMSIGLDTLSIHGHTPDITKVLKSLYGRDFKPDPTTGELTAG